MSLININYEKRLFVLLLHLVGNQIKKDERHFNSEFILYSMITYTIIMIVHINYLNKHKTDAVNDTGFFQIVIRLKLN